jgi:DnaK suppressor protein
MNTYERLVAERAETEAQAMTLAGDLDGIIAAAASGATDDEHDPEGATIAYERQHVASLLSDAQARLRELDHALAQLAAGSYGKCESCGEPIATERLAARPTASTCIACASR